MVSGWKRSVECGYMFKLPLVNRIDSSWKEDQRVEVRRVRQSLVFG